MHERYLDLAEAVNQATLPEASAVWAALERLKGAGSGEDRERQARYLADAIQRWVCQTLDKTLILLATSGEGGKLQPPPGVRVYPFPGFPSRPTDSGRSD